MFLLWDEFQSMQQQLFSMQNIWQQRRTILNFDFSHDEMLDDQPFYSNVYDSPFLSNSRQQNNSWRILENLMEIQQRCWAI